MIRGLFEKLGRTLTRSVLWSILLGLSSLGIAWYIAARSDTITAEDLVVAIAIEIGAAILTLAVVVLLEKRILDEAERRTREMLAAQAAPMPPPRRYGLAKAFAEVVPDPPNDPELYEFLMTALLNETMSPLRELLDEIDEAAARVNFATSSWHGPPDAIATPDDVVSYGGDHRWVHGPGLSDTPAWTVGIQAVARTRRRVHLTAFHGIASSGTQSSGYRWAHDGWSSVAEVGDTDEHAEVEAAVRRLAGELAERCPQYFARLQGLHAGAVADHEDGGP